MRDSLERRAHWAMLCPTQDGFEIRDVGALATLPAAALRLSLSHGPAHWRPLQGQQVTGAGQSEQCVSHGMSACVAAAA